MILEMILCRDKDSYRRETRDNRPIWPWRAGGGESNILLCRLDTVLMPVPLLQDLVGNSR